MIVGVLFAAAMGSSSYSPAIKESPPGEKMEIASSALKN
jgi:hypothetical protein